MRALFCQIPTSPVSTFPFMKVFFIYIPYFFLARLYVSTGRAIAVTTVLALASVSALASASTLLKMLKFLVKVFKSLYLLKRWMNLVDTLPDVRYWTEVLCCTVTTHISHLEVKVTVFEFLS